MVKNLEFNKNADGVYSTKIELSRDFFIALKEKKFLEKTSSFENIPESFPAEIIILDEKIKYIGNIVLYLYTNIPIPTKWKTPTKEYLNRDLIGEWHDSTTIECGFELSIEHIKRNSEKIIVELPI